MSASQAEHGGSIPLTCSTLPDACAFGSFIMTAKTSRIRANVYKTVAFPTTMSTESKWLVSLALKSINIPADRISSATKFIYIRLDAKWICEIYTLPSRPTIIKYLILTAFRHFLFIWKRKRLQKKSKLRAAPRDPANAAPQYLARDSQLVARHIRTQTRRSLNGCVLVRLASQAVPSPASIGLSNTAAQLLEA